MKSPFTDPVIVVPDDGNGYAFAENNEEEPRPLTLEEITFAVHAINQHEKLVAMLQELEWHCEYYGNDYHCPRCRDAEGSHAPYCPLAALLKEEKP